MGSQEEGILLVDKERGRTAFYLVKLLCKRTNIKKIGHAGILDPFATGIMVMLIGRPYTKMSNHFLNDDKEYIATLKFGMATNTFDCDGETTHSSAYIPTLSEIDGVIRAFQGSIQQVPPMFSAKKIEGQKLYVLARKGIEVKRRAIQVHLCIKVFDYSYPMLTICVTCSKGTYIRALAHDIGLQLGCFAHLVALRRTRSGHFVLEDCIEASSLSNPSFSYIPYLKRSI